MAPVALPHRRVPATRRDTEVAIISVHGLTRLRQIHPAVVDAGLSCLHRPDQAVVALAMVVRFLQQLLRRGEVFDILITLSIIVAFALNIGISWRQHDFHRRWEKRIGLMYTEEELLGGE